MLLNANTIAQANRVPNSRAHFGGHRQRCKSKISLNKKYSYSGEFVCERTNVLAVAKTRCGDFFWVVCFFLLSGYGVVAGVTIAGLT
jgi:hypothetical protein